MRNAAHMGRAFGLAFLFHVIPAASQEAMGRDLIPQCEVCHGPAGNSTTAGTPSIAGQPANFLENQLVYLREGLRNSAVMAPLAKGLKDEEITALARYFEGQKVVSSGATILDTALATKGAERASKLHCGQCHLPSFKGRAQMPRLAGQREDYLVDAMIGHRDGKRTGADTTMSEALYGVSDADIKALAHYLAHLE